jgi:hypothetical protein
MASLGMFGERVMGKMFGRNREEIREAGKLEQ